MDHDRNATRPPGEAVAHPPPGGAAARTAGNGSAAAQKRGFGLPVAIARRALHGQRFARDVTVAVVALVFSILFIWYSRNTGASGFQYWAPFVLAGVALLLGVPVYFAQRGKMTQPETVPEYR